MNKLIFLKITKNIKYLITNKPSARIKNELNPVWAKIGKLGWATIFFIYQLDNWGPNHKPTFISLLL